MASRLVPTRQAGEKTRPDITGLGEARTGQYVRGMSVGAEQSEQVGAYCPHCHLRIEAQVAGPWPPAPRRCPHCHLLIGAGRSRAEPSEEPGAKGTAAGVFSRQAKRHGGDGEGASDETILAAIRDAAAEVGERPERLLMVDYQQLSVRDTTLPPLHDVFAAFGSWKGARGRAAEGG